MDKCLHIIKDKSFGGGHKYPQITTVSIKDISWQAICDWEYCPWCGEKINGGEDV